MSHGNVTSNAATPARGPYDFAKPPKQSQDEQACPDFLLTTRIIMHWRYQNLRIVLHRPSLLAAALKRISPSGVSAEENLAVKKCRFVAAQTIQDINDMCPAELIAGWNAVWFMYQAVMVPLVSLFSHLSIQATMPASGSPESSSTSSGEGAEKWKQQIETAIAFFDRMKQWSIAATKSRDVVARLFEVANSAAQHQFLVQHAQSRLLQTGYNLPQTRMYAHNTSGYAAQNSRLAQETMSGSVHPAPPGPAPAHSQSNTMNGPQFWGFNPSGPAALDSFWQELQWDSEPIFAGSGQDTSMANMSNAGTGFALGDFDWYQGGDGNGGSMP